MMRVGQIAHVMRKDVREARWLLAAYIAVVAVSIASADGRLTASPQIFEAGMMFVVGLAMIIVATLVQADSPTHAEAFWVSHPLEPLAMFAAKVLLVIVVLMVPALAGQWHALAALDPEPGVLPRTLAMSAYAFALWLLISFVVAAVTKDIRTFIVTLVAIAVLIAIFVAVLPEFPWLSDSRQAIVGMVAVVGSLLFVAELYRTRDARRRTWVACIILVSAISYALVGGAPPSARSAVRSLVGPDQRPVIRYTVRAPSTPEAAQLTLDLRMDSAPPNRRIIVSPIGLRLTAARGDELMVRFEPAIATLASPDLPGSSIPWPSADSSSHAASFTARLSAAKIIVARAGIASGFADLRIRLLEPEVVGSLPLTMGASVARNGVRVTIEQVALEKPLALLTLHEKALAKRDVPVENVYSSEGAFDYVLVNESRHEARPMFRQSAIGHSGGMVLPGSDIRDETALFALRRRNGSSVIMRSDGVTMREDIETPSAPGETADRDWLRNAKLVIVRWIPRGSYETTGRVIVDTSAVGPARVPVPRR